MMNKYGGTFAQLADECIDEFVTDYTKHAENIEKLDKQMKLFPKLKPITDDRNVRDHMNIWTDNYLQKITKITHQGALSILQLLVMLAIFQRQLLQIYHLVVHMPKAPLRVLLPVVLKYLATLLD